MNASTIAASLERVRALRQSVEPTVELMEALETRVATLKERGAALAQTLPFTPGEEPGATGGAAAERAKALGRTLELAADLTNALKTQVTALERQCHGLEEALPSLSVARGSQREPAQPRSTSAPASGSKGVGGMTEPARLAAVAMAMQGHSRDAVEEYLRSLSVPNVEQILSSVFSDGGS